MNVLLFYLEVRRLGKTLIKNGSPRFRVPHVRIVRGAGVVAIPFISDALPESYPKNEGMGAEGTGFQCKMSSAFKIGMHLVGKSDLRDGNDVRIYHIQNTHRRAMATASMPT